MCLLSVLYHYLIASCSFDRVLRLRENLPDDARFLEVLVCLFFSPGVLSAVLAVIFTLFVEAAVEILHT